MNEKHTHPILPAIDAQHLLDAVRSEADALATPLSRLLEKELDRPLDELRSKIQQALVQAVDQVALRRPQLLDEFFAPINEAIEGILSEAPLASKDIADPLAEAGFWLTPSAPIVLITRLRRAAGPGPPGAAAVRHTLVDFYEADNALQLRHMVSGWAGNPFLARPYRIIQDALDAHVARQYTLSIPALLPIVERLLTALHGAPAKSGELPRIAAQHIQSSYTDFMREASKDILLHFITATRLYGSVPGQYFTPDTFPRWLASQGLTERDVVNRHAILHGVQVDYAGKENSLRVFLLLDVLSWLTRERQAE
jgi:hypothetical protein